MIFDKIFDIITQRERFGDMSDILDSAVGDAGHAVFLGEFADAVNSCSLRAADRADFLRDADRAGSHSDSQTVHASADQIESLILSHHVSANY